MVSLDLDFEVNEEHRNIIIDMNHKEDVYTIIQLCKKFNIKKRKYILFYHIIL